MAAAAALDTPRLARPVRRLQDLREEDFTGRPPHALGAAVLAEPFFQELASALHRRGALSPLSGGKALQANLWMASANATTPLHFDTSDNLFLQLRGSKRVFLLPPTAATTLPLESVHSPGSRQLDLPPHSTDATATADCLATGHGRLNAAIGPELAVEQLLAAELGPGDALWIPCAPAVAHPHPQMVVCCS